MYPTVWKTLVAAFASALRLSCAQRTRSVRSDTRAGPLLSPALLKELAPCLRASPLAKTEGNA